MAEEDTATTNTTLEPMVAEIFEIQSEKKTRRRRRRKNNVDLHTDSDGTDESDLEEYNEDLDSVGSLEDFVVDGSDHEISDYECSEDEMIMESDFESESENDDDDIITTGGQRRSQRLRRGVESSSRFYINNSTSSDSEDSDYVPE